MAFLKAGQSGVIIDENGNGFSIGSGSFILSANRKILKAGGGGGDTAVIGGRTYPTVTIGNQTWLAENLDYKFEGCLIVQGGTSSSYPRANYYNNDEATYGTDGRRWGLLYNHPAAIYLEEHKATLIPGWHVPTYNEVLELIDAVGGISVAGLKLKATTEWGAFGGDGSTLFGALPCGMYDGQFRRAGTSANFWMYMLSGRNTYSFTTSNSVSLTGYVGYLQHSLRLVKDA